MIRLIWAQGDGGVIGADGGLPWHLPEDLRLFRALTVGSTVVMGRRTWESLPPRMRPLPDRRNVVLSATLTSAAEGVQVARSAEEVPAGDGDLWVIGGGSVYAALLPRAAAAVVTEVDVRVPGDTWAPALPEGEWAPAARHPGTGWLTSSTGLRYRVTLSRRRGEPDGAATDRPAAVLARWSAGTGR
jgi:dihydrofolate reductase